MASSLVNGESSRQILGVGDFIFEPDKLKMHEQSFNLRHCGASYNVSYQSYVIILCYNGKKIILYQLVLSIFHLIFHVHIFTVIESESGLVPVIPKVHSTVRPIIEWEWEYEIKTTGMSFWKIFKHSLKPNYSSRVGGDKKGFLLITVNLRQMKTCFFG